VRQLLFDNDGIRLSIERRQFKYQHSLKQIWQWKEKRARYKTKTKNIKTTQKNFKQTGSAMALFFIIHTCAYCNKTHGFFHQNILCRITISAKGVNCRLLMGEHTDLTNSNPW